MTSVNALALDSIDNRYLLSGGGDSSIKLWDLQSRDDSKWMSTDAESVYKPAYIIPAKTVHQFGITHLKWWPDNGMWLSSSYDYSLKVFNSDTMQPVHSFNLESRVLNFDFDPQGSNSLVACCLDGGVGGIRLVDLRTLADSQTLGGGGKSKGGFGYMLSCAWSPTDHNLVVSGSQDGYCIGWDIRASNGCLFTLDYNLTTRNYTNSNRQLLFYEDIPRAHNGGINSLMFNDVGTELITLGTDEKIRVWDLTTGSKPLNKSINFGPLVRNKSSQYVQMCLSPTIESEMQYLWFPSENGELLIYRIQDGKLVARLTRHGNGLISSKVHALVYGRNNCIRYYAGCHDGSISVWGYAEDGMEEDNAPVNFDNGADNEQETTDTKPVDILDKIYHEMSASKA
ncbi:hypothetical protein FOA43_003858 [Brettanomyces nanus]|uniref:Uncharacterized protein n=1 Tax=Eeniella nana TaxID=13502 RepID=A0A875SA49_EENNA|nr:uncharacterized protein FOA43_003858 [Brettanomyces nanus]QPG76469.1 hypothetical protein FOA43_003858 [Brettanomyces nanus]